MIVHFSYYLVFVLPQFRTILPWLIVLPSLSGVHALNAVVGRLALVVSVALLPFPYQSALSIVRVSKVAATARHRLCTACRIVMPICHLVMPCRHRVMCHRVMPAMPLCHGICQSVTIVPLHAATHLYILCPRHSHILPLSPTFPHNGLNPNPNPLTISHLRIPSHGHHMING